MGPVSGGDPLQASQRRGDRTGSQETTHHIGKIELAHETTRKEIAAAAKAFKAPCEKQHAGGISIETVNQAQIRVLKLQTRDHGILLMGATSRLTQQT